MIRLMVAALVVAATGVGTGCRSCSSPYDYAPPVANCESHGGAACGTGRAGSAFSGGGAIAPQQYLDEQGVEIYHEQEAIGPQLMQSIAP